MPIFLSKEYAINSLPDKAIILLFKNNKIYGVFKKLNNKLISVENFRRGIEFDFFYKKLNKPFVKLTQKKFQQIYKELYKRNNPQLVADILFISKNKNKIILKYIKNQNNIFIQNYEITINEIYLNNLIKSINSLNIQDNLKILALKIYKLFFRQNSVFSTTDRFIYFIVDKKLRNIPFEIAFDGKNFLYEKNIISRGFENIAFSKNNFQLNNNFNICIPRYKDKNYFGKELKLERLMKGWDNLVIHKKFFTKSSIIKIISKSEIFYFSGHIEYDKKKYDFKLLLSDKDYLYFSELINLPELPGLIILNACFEYKFNLVVENIVEKLLAAGTKNVIIPYIAVPQSQSDMFTLFFIYLKKRLSIGEALHLAILNNHKTDGAYYRLYGYPLNKFF